MKFETNRAFAETLDELDPLKDFRAKFYFPKKSDGENVIYFTGNSLGLQPKTTRSAVLQELDDWARLGVEGHFSAENPWMPYHECVTDKLAEVVGAKPTEVVAMNSLSVNLHLLLATFYQPNGKRRKIVIEKGAFPSDQYAAKSHIVFKNHESDSNASAVMQSNVILLAPREGEACLRMNDIEKDLRENGDEIALILLGGVNYYTGQAFDMQRITEIGHAIGAAVGFDLAHAAGNLELRLHDWNVDFAAWCSYKYLNSGPGGIAAAFIHERHAQNTNLPRLSGWWGHDKKTRFLMPDDFSAIPSAEGWQLSNPPIFQLAALKASLEIFHQAGMKNLRDKSILLTNYLEFLLKEIDSKRIEIITPSDELQRGCQLSIRVRNADKSLFAAITRKGVIADWREPDVIRIAPVPLYNSYADAWDFTEILRGCLDV